jgi:hypothetical protein
MIALTSAMTDMEPQRIIFEVKPAARGRGFMAELQSRNNQPGAKKKLSPICEVSPYVSVC